MAVVILNTHHLDFKLTGFSFSHPPPHLCPVHPHLLILIKSRRGVFMAPTVLPFL